MQTFLALWGVSEKRAVGKTDCLPNPNTCSMLDQSCTRCGEKHVVISSSSVIIKLIPTPFSRPFMLIHAIRQFHDETKLWSNLNLLYLLFEICNNLSPEKMQSLQMCSSQMTLRWWERAGRVKADSVITPARWRNFHSLSECVSLTVQTSRWKEKQQLMCMQICDSGTDGFVPWIWLSLVFN